jgi:hypothetical protein
MIASSDGSNWQVLNEDAEYALEFLPDEFKQFWLYLFRFSKQAA